MYDRLSAAYEIQQWRLRGATITRRHAFDYVATLRTLYGAAHNPDERHARRPEPTDGQFVSAQRFLNIVSDAAAGFPLYEVLPVLAKPLT